MTRISGMLRGVRPRRAGRLPLVLLTAACVAAVTAAVSDATAVSPSLMVAQLGHWITDPSPDRVQHDEGAGAVDAEADPPGFERDSSVAQIDTSGYVVSRSTITSVDRATLSVTGVASLTAGEEPVDVQAGGVAYAVFRQAGTVVRLSGADPRAIPAGGSLADPVTAPGGALWLQRTGSNLICVLKPGARGVSCPGSAPAGHTGALTVVGTLPVFVDTTDDVLIPVGDDGLGRPVGIGADLPGTVMIAAADVGGRIAVVDRSALTLHLIDGSGIRAGRAGRPIEVALPDGDFAAPAAGRSAVVLLDLRGSRVLTYDRDGRPLQVVAVPRGAGEPHLTWDDDRQVYVDGVAGGHLLVIGDLGRGVPVPVRAPAAPILPSVGRSVPDTPRATTQPQQSPAPPRRTTPAQAVPVATAAPSRPGLPSGLTARVSAAGITVSWRAATANGAAVTGYRINWNGGSRTVAGSSRSTTLAGVSGGKTYRIRVAAENSAGRGQDAVVSVSVPLPAATGSDDCLSSGCESGHGKSSDG